MRGMLHMRIAAVAALAALVGCTGGDPKLMNISTTTPDEFGVLPNKPLQAPANYTTLPAPTPGGANLVDPTPEADAVAALGGNPDRLTRGTIHPGEQGLLAYTTRYGVPADIRTTLAAEDLAWRKANNGRLLERMFNVNVYHDSYKRMALDQHLELQRLRRMGVWTPSAPPDPEDRF